MAINIGKNTDGDVTYQNPPVDRVLFPNIKEGASLEEIQEAVDAWLDEHPEATTTVEDGSILPVKLDSSNSASDGYVLSYNATAEKFEWYDIGGELDEINTALTTKANVDGSYDNMTVGNAKQLVATVGITDKTPYNFRTSGGSADIGDREVDKIVGGTIAWNQLNALNAVNIPSSSSHPNLSIVKNADNSVTISGTSGNTTAYPSLSDITDVIPVASHVYLLTTGDYANDGGVRFYWNDSVKAIASGKKYAFYKNITNPSANGVVIRATIPANTEVDVTAKVMLFDLTQMFGSTIADYIYGLEQSQAGAGVAWFKKLFPKPYYAYDAGSLQSVQTSAHKMVGFNAFDGETEEGYWNTDTGEKDTWANHVRTKNYIPILPSTTYYKKCDTPGFSWHCYYDASKNFIGKASANPNTTFTTPSNAYFMTTYSETGYGSVYKNDLCINLSWDGERDGEYEAYKEYTYPLDDSLTLRGIPKLDSGNNLYYDGDVYEADGTVQRNYVELTLTGSETFYVGSTTYIKSDACDAYIGFETKNVLAGDTYLYANCNKLIATNIYGLWSATGHADEFSLNGGTQIHFNIANSKLGITDYTQETIESVATKIKAYVKSLYDSGTPLKFTLPLATPTTETADPFTNPQIVDDFGTEEYVDAGVTASTPTRDVAIPVGHETVYQANLRAKLEMAPNSPDGDGDYIVRQTSGENEYVLLEEELPSAPTEDGTYHLELTVASGTPTLTWVADE